MSNLDNQMLDLFRKMESSLETIARHSGVASSGSGSVGGGRTGSSALDEAAQEEFERKVRLSSKTLGSYNIHLKRVIKATKNLVADNNNASAAEADRNEALAVLAKSTFSLADRQEAAATEYNKLARQSLPQQAEAFSNLIKGASGLSNELSTSARKSSLLGAAMIKKAEAVNSDTSSVDYARFITQLQNAAGAVPESLLRSAKLIEDHVDDNGNVIFKDALTIEDFAALRSQIGEAEVILHEAFNNVPDAADILSKGLYNVVDGVTGKIQDADLVKAMVATAANLKLAGADINLNIPSRLNESGEEVADLDAWTKSVEGSTDEIKRIAVELDKFYAGAKQGKDGLDKLAVEANTVTGHLKRHYLTGEGLRNTWQKFTGDLVTTAGVLASLRNTVGKLKTVTEEASDFNVAGISASFWETQMASIAMGMSFKESSELIQENKRLIGLYGSEAFMSLRDGMEETFNQFGYTFNQAAGLIGPATEAAIASGVNVKDSNALNKYMGETMSAFQNVNKVINISAAEYGKLNAELYSNSDVMNNMLGLNAEQSRMYAKNLEAQRNELIQRGLSAQQAQEMVRAQEAAKRAKLMERYKGGAMLMLQMQQLGFSSEDSMRAMRVHQKGARATDEEKAFLTSVTAQLGQRREAAIRDSGISDAEAQAREMFFERAELGGALEGMIESGKAAAIAGRANAGQTAAEAARAGTEGAPSSTWMNITEIFETVSSVINNSLVAAAGAGAVSLFALTKAAMLASTALTLMGGKGLAGGLLGKMGGKLGGLVKGGGALLGTVAKATPVGRLASGALAIGGLMGLGSGVTQDNKDGGSFWGSVLSGAATGAGVGMLGTPLMAAIGGAAGGIGGGLLHWMRQPSATPGTTSPESLTVGDPVNKEQMLQAPGGVLSVKDTDAQAQLVIIAQQITEAVKLLSELSTADQKVAARSIASSNLRPAIPTSTAYASGRAM